ncbi:DUF6777 domain-containing protein [Streptomyces sp. NPDC004065]|uniref:DUF6777 domain-containing protein n=1 Tax=Streptomyces sp. NPDC004065 TaxID=3364689 RepID=UPI00384FDA81
MLAAVVAAAVVVAVVLTGTGGSQKGEVFLQPAAATGPDPFTRSSVTADSGATAAKTAQGKAAAGPSSPAGTQSMAPNTVRAVSGGAPGLYQGARNDAVCDVEKEIADLRAHPDRNRAYAATVGVRPDGVPAYLRSLTPVQLGMDTRVTAHGYRDGSVTSYQAVLQAGTAVLVDGRGVPKDRCACGNPLTPPVAQPGTPDYTGQTWSSYRPQDVVVVTPAPQPVKEFVLFDPHQDKYFARKRGDHGGKDEWTHAPKHPPAPTASVSLPSGTPSSVSKPPSAPSSPGAPPPSSNAPQPASPGSSNPPASEKPASPGSQPPPSGEPSSAPSAPESSPNAPPPSSEKPAAPPSQPSQPSQPEQPSAPPPSAPQSERTAPPQEQPPSQSRGSEPLPSAPPSAPQSERSAPVQQQPPSQSRGSEPLPTSAAPAGTPS